MRMVKSKAGVFPSAVQIKSRLNKITNQIITDQTSTALLEW